MLHFVWGHLSRKQKVVGQSCQKPSTCSADDEVPPLNPPVDQCDMETLSEMEEGLQESTAVQGTEDDDKEGNGGSKEKKQRMGFRCDLYNASIILFSKIRVMSKGRLERKSEFLEESGGKN